MTYYYGPGAHKIRGQRMTLADRFRRWKRRRKQNDLWNLKGRWGV